MAIALITLPDLAPGQATGYPEFITQLRITYAQLATVMNVTLPSFSTIAAGQGDPVGDANKFKALANQLVQLANGTSGGGSIPTTITPLTSAYAYTEARADRNGHPFPDSLAQVSGTTEATTLSVRLHTNSPYQGTLAVFVNDVWFAAFLTQSGSGNSASLAERVETFAVAGLPAGSKKITFDLGAVGRDDTNGGDYFWQWLDFDVPAGTSWTPLPWTKKTGELILTVSDSIGVEATCQPGRGWVNQLRHKPTRVSTDLVCLGYGGASPQVLIGSASARTALVNRLISLATGYSRVRVVVALGTNQNMGYGASNLQADLISLGTALAGASISGFTLADSYFIQLVPPNNGVDFSDFRAAQATAAQQLGARTVDAFAGQSPHASDPHFDTSTTYAVNTAAANAYDAALVDAAAIGYQTIDSQDFETGYPSNWAAAAGYAVSTDRASSGTQGLKYTASSNGGAAGPPQAVIYGRFSVDIYLGKPTGSSDAYPFVQFAVNADNYYYAQASVTQPVSTTAAMIGATFYCGRHTSTGYASLQDGATIQTPVGFYRFTMGRVGNRVTMSVVRRSDGAYLTAANTFSATPSFFYDAVDASPLPAVAGPSCFSVLGLSAGDVSYFDKVLLESHT